MYAWLILLIVLLPGCGGDGNSAPLATPVPAQEPNPSSPPPPPPALLVWQLKAVLADRNNIAGAFSYKSKTTPRPSQMTPTFSGHTNGLYYELTDWSINHASYTWLKAASANTAELCVGVCIPLSPPMELVTFDNGFQRLLIAHLLPDGVTLPQTQADWGPVYLPGCWLRWRYVPGVHNDYIGIIQVELTAVPFADQ